GRVAPPARGSPRARGGQRHLDPRGEHDRLVGPVRALPPAVHVHHVQPPGHARRPELLLDPLGHAPVRFAHACFLWGVDPPRPPVRSAHACFLWGADSPHPPLRSAHACFLWGVDPPRPPVRFAHARNPASGRGTTRRAGATPSSGVIPASRRSTAVATSAKSPIARRWSGSPARRQTHDVRHASGSPTSGRHVTPAVTSVRGERATA